MKFIFPKNYCIKPKFLGLIDYTTLIMNIVFDLIIISVCLFLFKNITITLFVSISLCFPILLLSIVGLNNENTFFVLFYITKYFLKPKLYLYDKI